MNLNKFFKLFLFTLFFSGIFLVYTDFVVAGIPSDASTPSPEGDGVVQPSPQSTPQPEKKGTCRCDFVVDGPLCSGGGSIEVKFGSQLNISEVVSKYSFGPLCVIKNFIVEQLKVVSSFTVNEENCNQASSSGEEAGHTYEISCSSKFDSEGGSNSGAGGSNLLSSVEGISNLNKIKYSSLQGLIGGFIKTAMGVMGSIALIMVVYGGFTAMTAAGNAEKVKKGMEILLWSGLGIVVIFASYMIVDLVFEAFR